MKKQLVLGLVLLASVGSIFGSQDHYIGSYIQDESDAKKKCSTACANYGGWTGQWYNPYEDEGICNCNS